MNIKKPSTTKLLVQTSLKTSNLQRYLGGLSSELSNGVKMFAPKTLHEAVRIAKLQETKLGTASKTFQQWCSQHRQLVGEKEWPNNVGEATRKSGQESCC